MSDSPPKAAAAAAAAAAAENKAETVEAAAATTDVKARVLKQVEFYFGDSNLPRDRFLLGQTQKTEEGWVPVATLMSFKRMKEISTDAAVVVEALRASKGLLAVSADGTLVRRTTPLPAKGASAHDERSIYAKGVPMDSTVDSLTAFFAAFGPVLSVRMRRNKDRSFKGSVFVEFDSKDKAAEVVAAGIKGADDEPLQVEAKLAYVERKRKEFEARKAADGGASPKKAAPGSPSARGTKRKAEGEADQAESKDGDDDAAAGADDGEAPFGKNLLVKLAGVGADSSRESIKEALAAAGVKVEYTDFSRGLTDAVVRLPAGSDAAAVAKQLAEAKVEVSGATPTVTAIEGDEEAEYHNKVRSFKRRRSNNGGRAGGRRNKNRR